MILFPHWLTAHRMLIALLGLCLLAAPFSANCCQSLPNTTPAPSSPPCHASMPDELGLAAQCHSYTGCADMLFLMPPARVNELSNSLLFARLHDSALAISEVAEFLNVSLLLRSRPPDSPQPFRSSPPSLLSSPLKL